MKRPAFGERVAANWRAITDHINGLAFEPEPEQHEAADDATEERTLDDGH